MKGTDTRERILEVAARLFREQSFDGTAVSAILQDADVNSGSLYHFFPGKEALLGGVVDRYVERLGPDGDGHSVATHGAPPPERPYITPPRCAPPV